MGFTDTQQGYITIGAEVLQSISLMSIPATLSGALPSWFPVTLFLCGAASKGLMQFKGSSVAQQQTVLDTLHDFAQVWANMSPDQQTKLLAELPLLLPLLSTVSKQPVVAVPAPPAAAPPAK